MTTDQWWLILYILLGIACLIATPFQKPYDGDVSEDARQRSMRGKR